MTIKVPDSWNQISLNQFSELANIENLSNHLIEFVALMCKIEVKEVESWSPDDFANVLTQLNWAFKMPDESRYNNEIKVDGLYYSLIDLNKLSIRQWVNMMYFVKEPTKNYVNIFSLLYRPELSEAKDVGNSMMIGDVYGALVFFCLIEQKYLINIQSYLLDQMTKKMKSEAKRKNKGWKGLMRKVNERRQKDILHGMSSSTV